ncbi:SDR family oxidoreductase [Streptomyces sp. WMMC1477]|uniref:SDR family oxidoreductase n=1 Tax=Streptomyces sp. WMMC1477 TaxID=3015155 RepID=UPI0022B6824C|nr:SDR family oxidoreductase [Streptomyces sp. WMMC1477]MCZ7432579.1 SDR family oxidoreductase [Streptomyces sp. WMMC1477]
MSNGGGAELPAGARERQVTTAEGVRLSLVELGSPERPTIVLVHGYPDSKELWWPVARRLAGRFHVVAYDVRGHGRSTAPRPLHGGFTLEKLTADFLAVADAVSPDAPVHLVGHDWGSVQGWEFATARRTRGRVASFTSVSGPSLDHLGHWIRQRRARPTPRHVGQLLRQQAKSWYVHFLLTRLAEPAWRGPLGTRWPTMVRRAEGLTDADFPSASLRQDAVHGIWLYRDNGHRVRRPRTDAYAHVPVQLVVPTRDPYLSPALYDGLELWVPRLTRRTLPVRHWVPRTRPDQLASWIAAFVAEHEGSTAGPGHEARARGPYADRFGGQLVLVTGAASGIGRAVALSFAEAGARVIAVDRDAEGAARTAETARLVGAQEAWPEEVDVADEHAMEKLATRVAAEHGIVDVLVNNAGVGVTGPLLDTTTEDWRRLLDVNLWGVIHGCRLFGRQMAERGQGGHIVNTASAAAFLPSTALPAYSTSKAAVLMLTESLRAELAGRGIGVTAICPGVVNTNITATSRFVGVGEEEQRRRREKAARLYARRDYAPEKVADTVLKAVVRNRAVVPVTPEARVVRALSRLSPRLLRAAARLNLPG